MLRELIKTLLTRFFGSTRQNHALEHATVAVLLSRASRPLRIVGRASGDGFYIHATVSAEELEDAAREALDRMQGGDGHLAVSPFCGTNIAVAGALAAIACLLTLGTKDRIGRLPAAIAAATGAVMLAQPLGAMAQRHITTTSDVSDLRITGVAPKRVAGREVHKVETERVRQHTPFVPPRTPMG